MEDTEQAEIARAVKKPDVFNGDRAKWLDFKNDFTNFMTAIKTQFLDDMRAAASLNEPADDNGDTNLRARSMALYSVLYSYLKDSAKSLAAPVEDSHNGFELWRLLVRDMEPATGLRKLALARQINKAEKLKGKNESNFAQAVRAWEKDIEGYDKIPGIGGINARFDEHSKMAILVENSPDGVRGSLETGGELTGYAMLRARIEAYLRTRGVWQIGDTAAAATPMELDAVNYKGGGKKGAKGKDGGKGLGKDGKAQRDCYRCLGKNHTPYDCRWKEETCNTCGKIGHIAKACKTGAKSTKGSGKQQSSGKTNWQQPPPGKGNGKAGDECYVCGGTGHRAHACPKRWHPAHNVQQQFQPQQQQLQMPSWPPAAASTVGPGDSVSNVGGQQQQPHQPPGSQASTTKGDQGKGSWKGAWAVEIAQTLDEIYTQDWLLGMVACEELYAVTEVGSADKEGDVTAKEHEEEL